MITRRSWFVYGMLLAIWLVLIGWQVAEHVRMRKAARAGLRHRAEDISNTLASIMRSQRFFVRQDRIETVLNELVDQGEVYSIALLTATNRPVARAGPVIELPKDEVPKNEYWDEQAQTVTLRNLVDLGTNV